MSLELDQKCIDTIRFLAVDMVQKADSGHPGLPLGAAPMAYVLWNRYLKHNPLNPQWPDRDRFVLSAGHGSALLYALLFLYGYGLTLDDIRQFRQWGSKTPGHPERGHTPGVEVTTGPLGQGFGNAVGMAIAEAQLAARYNRDAYMLFDHYTYALASDGDLMEGVASEAASLAGHLKLGRLIVLYDDNRVTLAGSTDVTFSENRVQRFDAYGWHTITVEDGNDLGAIDMAISQARREVARPSLIRVRTHIGFGSPEQDSYKVHGSALGEENVRKTKQKLGWPPEPDFLVPDDVSAHMRRVAERGREQEHDWTQRLIDYRNHYPDLFEELDTRLRAALPEAWDADIPVFPPDEKGLATRESSGKVMNALAPRLPALAGRRERARHARILWQGDERAGAAAAGAGRRLGRSRSFHQDRVKRVRRFPPAAHGRSGRARVSDRTWRLHRPQHPFRRARTCHGRDRERAGRAWRLHSLRRHVSHLFRLHAATDPPGGADGPARGARVYA